MTVEQFQQFIDDAAYSSAEKPEQWRGVDTRYSPTPDCPVNSVNWFDAVLFCNWLSTKERRKPAYARTGKKWKCMDDENKEDECDTWPVISA